METEIQLRLGRRRWARDIVRRWAVFAADHEVPINYRGPNSPVDFNNDTWCDRVRIYVKAGAPQWITRLLNEQTYEQPTCRPDEYPTYENTKRRAQDWAENQVIMLIKEREYVQPELPLFTMDD